MAREHCVNATTVLSFLMGGIIIGVGIALLVAPQSRELQERIRSAIGKKEKLTREQIIEEGIQCAVPEGVDMCYPRQGEET
jgi:gas vesicle protein